MQAWDFEKPIVELGKKIQELKDFSTSKGVDLSPEIAKLHEKLTKLKKEVYLRLSPWQKVQIARHPSRPTSRDYISMMLQDFISLCGDRLYGEDKAIIGGFGMLWGRTIVCSGHQKGKDTKENI